MAKIYFKDLKNHLGEELCVEGFVDKIRDLQYVQFVILRDGTGEVQVTIEKNDDNKSLNEIVSGLTPESTLYVTGKLMDSPNVKLNGMELIPEMIQVTSESAPELPIDIKDKGKALRETNGF